MYMEFTIPGWLAMCFFTRSFNESFFVASMSWRGPWAARRNL